MNLSKILLIAGLLVFAVLSLWDGVTGPARAGSAKEPDPTRREAWSAGTASGEGNFQSYCMPCHGAAGKGDGVLADSLDVKPRNLSDPAFASTKTNDHIFKVIKKGGISVGLSENMTPFSGQLSDQEIRNVVAYLRKEICKCTYKGK